MNIRLSQNHHRKRALRGILPDDIIERPKMGFATPMSQWLRGDFGARVEATVLGSDIVKDDFFDRDFIAQWFRDHCDGRADEAVRLWTVFNLAAWHEHWIR